MCGLIAYLYEQGITLAEMYIGNFLLRSQSNDILFFDPNIRSLYEGPVPESQRGYEIANLALILQRFLSVEHVELHDLLYETIRGANASTYEFGRALEQFFIDEPIDGALADLAGFSDVGLIRSLNEDNWGWKKINPNTNIYVVADGMGGHDCGEIASQMAVDVICEEALKRYHELSAQNSELGLDVLEELLQNSFQAANNSIKQYSETVGSDMGTTMVCALIITHQGQKYALVANVGDSRGYLYRGDTLHQITKDHSLVAKMVEQKQLTKEEARVHPHSNILLRTVGTDRNISIDVFRVGLQENDIILLCSDGLWGEVEDEKLESLVGGDPQLSLVCRSLLRASHLGGGRDNCTIMLVRI